MKKYTSCTICTVTYYRRKTGPIQRNNKINFAACSKPGQLLRVNNPYRVKSPICSLTAAFNILHSTLNILRSLHPRLNRFKRLNESGIKTHGFYGNIQNITTLPLQRASTPKEGGGHQNPDNFKKRTKGAK